MINIFVLFKCLYPFVLCRYLREKPKKSDEKREKRQKRDEAQQNFKVVLIIRFVLILQLSYNI